MQTVEKHAPMKQRYERKNTCPFMNKELRKAIYRKHMLYNKYLKNKCNNTWEKYRVQRNLVNKLKKKSESIYFSERCVGGSKTADFWTTIKPFFSKKGTKDKCKIVLNENEDLVTETPKVTEIFNNFFTHVADNIGKDYIFDPKTHPSILKIKENCKASEEFCFNPVFH